MASVRDDGLVLDDGTAFAILSNADRVDLVPLAKSLIEIVEPVKNKALVADLSHPGVFEDPAVTALAKQVIGQLADASHRPLAPHRGLRRKT